ncbi:cupin domain-containing protein [Pseudarthrobacter sp. Y6]|uniref:cupin domain-containing protein n=1 Tax=Pseudarthrobacter sp. Y6 TaxID=3418422 RepID=UPI003CFB66F2
MTIIPLTRRPGGVQAPKHILHSVGQEEPTPWVHEGYELLHVLNGNLRMVLGEQDFVVAAGEAVEVGTRIHWFGCADAMPVEFLSLFGRQGERMHVRA